MAQDQPTKEAPFRYCDAAAMELTAEEIQHLEQLPDAAHEVRPEVECEMRFGHTGAHVGLGQTDDRGADGVTNWWLRWTDDGERTWAHDASCEHEEKPGAVEMCLLPYGHEGPHHWT